MTGFAWHKWLAPLLLVISFMILQIPRFEPEFLNRLERTLSDIRLQQSLFNKQDHRIAIIDIDEFSLNQHGQWPWPRRTIASLVDNLFDQYQVNALGLDMVFAEPEADQVAQRLLELSRQQLSHNVEFLDAVSEDLARPPPDEALAKSFEGRRVVTGMVFNANGRDRINFAPTPLAELPADLADKLLLNAQPGYTANQPILQQTAHSSGFFNNTTVDSDGIFRRVPLIQLHDNKLYPSLALAVARAALGDLPYDIQLVNQPPYLAIELFQLGSLLLPLDQNGAVTVPYIGPAGSFEYISASAILDQTYPKDQLTNKIVLLGTSAAGLQDLRATPVGKNYPGVEVHANIISAILNQTFPENPPWSLGANLLVTAFTGLLMSLLISRLAPLPAMLSAMVLVAAVVAVNYWAWLNLFILALAPPLIVIAGLYIWHTSYGFLVENRHKKRLAQQFGQYIPPDLVSDLVDRGHELSLKGENRQMTVLFSDVRGFTTLSEGLNPEELSELMNRLLTPLTRLIHEHHGTIDKYMGDAIMAFWGAPVPLEDHARLSVQTALAFQLAAADMREDFSKRNLPALKIGVGVNSGSMSVGNMGSEFRMAYTVLGDAVNLGSRIEGLTKQYGVDILIGEDTRNQISDLVSRKIDLVRVKGKNEPVAIFEPIGFADSTPAEIVAAAQLFDEFHHLYCQQDWPAASKVLDELENNSSLNNQVLYQMYRQRINDLQINCPESGWTGVHTHTTK